MMGRIMNTSVRHYMLLFSISVLGLSAMVLLAGDSVLWAQTSRTRVEKVRTVYPNEFGVSHPVGLSYSEKGEHFFVSGNGPTDRAAKGTRMVSLTFYEDLVETTDFDFAVDELMNVVFDNEGQRLFLLQSEKELVEVSATDEALLDSSQQTRFDLSSLSLVKPQGMAIDTANNRLFIYDRATSKVVSVSLDETLGSEQAESSTIDLSFLRKRDLRGLAFNPATENLYLLSPKEEELYEITQDGERVAIYEMAGLGLADPRALTFAPSADLTDDPETMHLFLVDRGKPLYERNPLLDHHIYLPIAFFTGESASSSADTEPKATAQPGKIVELRFVSEEEQSRVAVSVPLIPSQLIQTIDTSVFDPPSPDPAGVTYLFDDDQLMVSDSEVNEMPALFEGDNLFEVDLDGILERTGSTIDYAVPPKTSDEPTGIGFNPSNGHLFLSDDRADRIFEVDPGTDGEFGTSDDVVTSFRTKKFEPRGKDPEGVTFDPSSGDLFIIDGVNEEVYRVDPGPNGIFDGVPSAGGDDIETNFDLTVLGISDPEGLDYDPATGDLIIVGSSTEVMYQVTTSGSLVAEIDIFHTNAIKPAGVTLAPGSINSSDMNFYLADRGIDNNEDPNENDGKIYEITLNITGTPTPTPTNTFTPTPTPTIACAGSLQTVSIRVADGDDDAEEDDSDGEVDLESTDLELVELAGQSYHVGIRFPNVTIPAGAEVARAYIEFETDEKKTAPTSLVIHGEDVNDASEFDNDDFDISGRTKTSTSVNWSNIPHWDEEGETHQTPDLSSLIEEIVDISGWTSGNAMAFIMTGSGVRTAESFEGAPNGAPLLFVEYCGNPLHNTGMATPTGTPSVVMPTYTPTPTGK